jgi:hypothetical protein
LKATVRRPCRTTAHGCGLGPGSFAENLTVEGALEDALCIGDTGLTVPTKRGRVPLMHGAVRVVYSTGEGTP